jgi:hypothetical protein
MEDPFLESAIREARQGLRDGGNPSALSSYMAARLLVAGTTTASTSEESHLPSSQRVCGASPVYDLGL